MVTSFSFDHLTGENREKMRDARCEIKIRDARLKNTRCEIRKCKMRDKYAICEIKKMRDVR